MSLRSKLDANTRRRALRFLVVGGGSAVLYFAVLKGLLRSMGDTAAMSTSWAITTLMHYLANKFWALPSKRTDAGRQLGEYLFAMVLSYTINLGSFKLCMLWFGLGPMWAAFWAVPPSTLVVFLILNYRVFRASRPAAGKTEA